MVAPSIKQRDHKEGNGALLAPSSNTARSSVTSSPSSTIEASLTADSNITPPPPTTTTTTRRRPSAEQDKEVDRRQNEVDQTPRLSPPSTPPPMLDEDDEQTATGAVLLSQPTTTTTTTVLNVSAVTVTDQLNGGLLSQQQQQPQQYPPASQQNQRQEDLAHRVQFLEEQLQTLLSKLADGGQVSPPHNLPSFSQLYLSSTTRLAGTPPTGSSSALPLSRRQQNQYLDHYGYLASPDSPYRSEAVATQRPPDTTHAAVPALDSPHPTTVVVKDLFALPSLPGSRSLSQRILSDDSFRDELQDAMDAAAAVTSERLQAPVLTSEPAPSHEDEPEKDSNVHITTPSTSAAVTPVRRPREESMDATTATITRRARQESMDSTNTTGTNQQQQQQQSRDPRSKWMDYLNSFQESTPDVDLQMEEFVKIPSQVEQLLSFGFWICVDCFLYTVTMLPIRFVWSLLLLLMIPFTKTQTTKLGSSGRLANWTFHRRHMYQLIQVSIIYFVYRVILYPISIGKLYHWIRGQAMLKLYVLIAIVEVFDRLMCALGQDCLDSMYWNTTRRPRSMRMLVSVAVVLVYACVHTALLFVHVATLNVAINSSDQALLTLLISGNFAEIKSTVFKKYNKQFLFKISASDICERFKLALFLLLVLVLNMAQGGGGGGSSGDDDRPQQRSIGLFFFSISVDEHLLPWEYLQMCGFVWCAEMLSDWIKHSFITKFNFIKSTVYPEYALILAGDVTGIGHEEVNLDHSHAVVKRIGLAQIPLVCVMVRLLAEAARYHQAAEENAPTEPGRTRRMPPWTIWIFCWILALMAKLLLGSYLARASWTRLEEAPTIMNSSSYNSTSAKKKKYSKTPLRTKTKTTTSNHAKGEHDSHSVNHHHHNKTVTIASPSSTTLTGTATTTTTSNTPQAGCNRKKKVQ